ncbi:MAG: HD domain-containing protein [Acidobacteria bacterium]|nr:HD domain-containing protein [Acidobacteriota bacterium]
MNWAELPHKLKAYIVVMASLALPVLSWAVWELFNSGPINLVWLVFAATALITVPYSHLFPSYNATITIGDTYIMAIAMMFGTAPCVIAMACYIFCISVFAKIPKVYTYRVIFNTATNICCALIYSSIYEALVKGSNEFKDILIPAIVLVAVYFLTNSILTSIAIAWASGEKVLKFWAKSCMPLAVEYPFSLSLALLMVFISKTNEYLPLVLSPFIYVGWGWYKANKARGMEAEKHLKEQEQLYMRTVESLALAVDAKDQTTYGHIRRVRVYAKGLAQLLGLNNPIELKAIEIGSLLHDIGKLAIDDYILNKPGRLSKQEFEKIKIHAAAGDEILQHVQFPFPVAQYVRYHHERWDGLGYPDGLKGEEIPLGARILAVADAFDAIRFSRPYKLAIPMDEALELLRAQSGTIYDPKLIQLFVDNIEQLERAALRESQNVPEPSFRKYFETVNREISAADNSVADLACLHNVPSELISLSEFCSSMVGNLDLDDALPILSSRLKRILPYDACAFYLKDGDECLRAAHASGVFSELIRQNLMSIGKGISGWATAYKRPMINASPVLDFPYAISDFSSFGDALVVPIMQEDESLGTISLYAKQAQTYGPYELNILQALAALTAPLISESLKQRYASSEEVLDPTTRLHRISYLETIGSQLISLAAKNRSPVSLLYIEIRNLNQIIRLYGANSGNLVLKRVAECIKPELRATDISVRFGQHGFVALLPGVNDDQALHCAQRLKNQIKAQVSIGLTQSVLIDCQVSIASYPRDGITVFALLQSAQKYIKATSQEIASQDGNVVGFTPRF